MFAAFILQYRWPLLAVIASGTAFFAWQFRHFSVDNDPLEQLPEDTPEVQVLREFQANFGRIDLLVVALEVQNDDIAIFSAPVLDAIASLTNQFEELDGIESVVSLANVSELRESDGMVEARPLFDRLADGKAAPADLEEIALANPAWVGNVVSADAAAVAFNLFVEESLTEQDDRTHLVRSIREILAADTPRGLHPTVTGSAAIVLDSIDYLSQDVHRYLRYTPVIMALLLLALFRRASAFLIPILLIVFAVIWTLGLFFLTGNSIGMATTLLPTLISLIALSDVIHALTHYYGLEIPDKRERIVQTMEHMIRACFMTSITTAVGIGSLSSSSVATIRQFGVWSAIGIFIAYCLVMILVPIFLSFLPAPRPRASRAEAARHWGNAVAAFAQSKSRLIWGTTAVTLVVAGILISNVRIETQVSTFLPQNAPSLEGLKVVDEKLAGAESIELMITAEPGTFEQAWAIREIDELHRFVQDLPGVNMAFSPASIIRDAHRTLGRPDSSDPAAALPGNDNEVAEYFFMLSVSAWAEHLTSFVVDDFSAARISARVQAASTAEHLEYFRRIETFAAQNLDPRLTLETTGIMRIFATHVSALIKSLFRSLSWTIGLIAILLIIHFRSFKVAFVSLLPNIVPVVIPLGVMGLAGISLTGGTVMVSCIAIGLAVDHDIHFLARYRRETASGLGLHEALRVTIGHTGKAIVIVSIVIAGGFAIFLFSSFVPNRYFGLLVAIAMLTAPIVDLLLLPLLIALARLK